MIVKMPMFRCMRCGALWLPRTQKPKACPACKSRNWDTKKAGVVSGRIRTRPKAVSSIVGASKAVKLGVNTATVGCGDGPGYKITVIGRKSFYPARTGFEHDNTAFSTLKHKEAMNGGQSTENISSK